MKIDLDKIKCSRTETFYIGEYLGHPIIYRDRCTELPVETIIALADSYATPPLAGSFDEGDVKIKDVAKLSIDSSEWDVIEEHVKEWEERKTAEVAEMIKNSPFPNRKMIYRNNIWEIYIDTPEEQMKLIPLLLNRKKPKEPDNLSYGGIEIRDLNGVLSKM